MHTLKMFAFRKMSDPIWPERRPKNGSAVSENQSWFQAAHLKTTNAIEPDWTRYLGTRVVPGGDLA